MVRKKSLRDSSAKATPTQTSQVEMAFTDPLLVAPLTRTWLRKFLLGLAGAFALLAVVFALYNVWVGSEAESAKAALAKGDLASMSEAVETLSSPHLFAGYEPYHGFGKESAVQWQNKAQAVLSAGGDYSEVDLGFLIHRPDHYLAAWKEVRSAQNPPVPGDQTVLSSILSRQMNAVSNTWVFVGYLVVVSLIMALVLVLYTRRWNRGV